MRPVRAVFLVIGVAAALFGLLFMAQGAGWVHWPASSFMLEQREWVVRGGLLAAVGVLLILRSSVRRRRR